MQDSPLAEETISSILTALSGFTIGLKYACLMERGTNRDIAGKLQPEAGKDTSSETPGHPKTPKDIGIIPLWERGAGNIEDVLEFP
ncbi:MAG: hypothetical protein ABIN99_12090 [Nitrosospira sp.]